MAQKRMVIILSLHLFLRSMTCCIVDTLMIDGFAFVKAGTISLFGEAISAVAYFDYLDIL